MLKDLKRKSILFGAIVLMIVVWLSSYYNYTAIQDHVIAREQDQLLSLAETVAESIEAFFEGYSRDLVVLSQNKLFILDYSQYYDELEAHEPWSHLEAYLATHRDDLEAIGLVDLQGNSVYHFGTKKEMPFPKADLEAIKASKSGLIGAIYSHEGNLFINIMRPFGFDTDKGLVLYTTVRLETFYGKVIYPVRAGDKGYASIKDDDGVIIMHPNKIDIGFNVLEVRKKQYPDFDWSELEGLVTRQINGESGVGVYHSLWFTEDASKRVKKFNAFSPAWLGDQFWIVNISKDYDEVIAFLRFRLYGLMAVNLSVLVFFVSSVLLYDRLIKDRQALSIQENLSLEVTQLNETLKNDLLQRQRMHQDMQRSKEWYEDIFNGLSEGLIVCTLEDSHGDIYILDANNTMQSLSGFDVQQLLMTPIKHLFASSGDYQRLTQSINCEIDSLACERDFFTQESHWITADGVEFPVEISCRIMVMNDDRRIVMILRDLTDLRTQEAMMIYQSRMAAMGEMLANIAHQWRQPLAVMHMLFDNVWDAFRFGELDDGLLEKQYNRMKSITQHMSKTIDDFRYFFNPLAEKRTFLVSHAIQIAITLVEETLKHSSIELSVHIEQDVLLHNQESQLSQVLLALIHNAKDALIANRETDRRLEVFVSKVNGNVLIHIEDNAGGVSDALLEKLFEPYYTTKSNQEGTGLGLYISKVIIEHNYKGKIVAHNGALGLSVRMTLPEGVQ